MTSARYQVLHDTHYSYDAPVSLAQQLAHLWPRPCAWQLCRSQALDITPVPTQRIDGHDVFGNPLTRLAFERPHDALTVKARLEVEVLPRQVPAIAASPPWEVANRSLCYSAKPMSRDLLKACRFRFESPYVPLRKPFAAFADSCFPAQRPLLECAGALMAKIYEQFTYDGSATQVATPLLEVLEQRRGVCQDFAHLMIACLRSRGLAARYISGYLLTEPAPGMTRLVGADASHAWVAVYCPVNGWVEFDPTNNVRPGLGHVTLAWGRDFSDVSPLRGVILGGGSHDPDVRVTVQPLEAAMEAV